MSPDDPRHGTNAGYLAHFSHAEKPCAACSSARYRAQKQWRFDEHRGERFTYPADEVRTLLTPWLNMGIHPSAIANAAGMEGQRGGSFATLLRDGGTVRRATWNRLAALTEESFSDGVFLNADLTRARIYSLMAAGHRLADMPINSTGHWRESPQVKAGLARAIREHFRTNEATVGRHAHTMTRARNAGHRPPLAWDDPDTLAWPDQDRRKRPRFTDAPPLMLDDVAIDRRLAGDKAIPLTVAEKAEARRRWTAAGRPLNELERVTGINSHRRYEEAS